MSDDLESSLSAIPIGLREPLINQFKEILSDYRSGRWESVGLKAGKICEIIHTILSGYVSGQYASAPTKPPNMMTACLALEQAPSATFSRSVRIQIPRILIAVYELRNNRAIGHVGGDVDPNHMDAEFFLRSSKWLVAELVRVFGSVSIDISYKIIESITDRLIPVVWEADKIKRVLNSKLSAKDKALILAYSAPNGVAVLDLFDWSGYTNISRFRNSILSDLDKDSLIIFDRLNDKVTISPTGIKKIELSGMLIMP